MWSETIAHGVSKRLEREVMGRVVVGRVAFCAGRFVARFEFEHIAVGHFMACFASVYVR